MEYKQIEINSTMNEQRNYAVGSTNVILTKTDKSP